MHRVAELAIFYTSTIPTVNIHVELLTGYDLLGHRGSKAQRSRPLRSK